MGYWRGGGVYMSNGYLRMQGCTVVENEVSGVPRTDSLDRPNLAGGVAATIGNAHAVEEMIIGHSIVTGNLVHELGPGGVVAATYPQDVFTGSLLYFRSQGYNRFGALEFSHILVPVDQRLWQSLCRKHYPKQGDADGVAASDVLDLVGGVDLSSWMLSAGVGAGTPTPVRYAPAGSALDQVPTTTYVVQETFAEIEVDRGATDDFLPILLARIEAHWGPVGFAADFTTDFEAYLQTVDVDEDTAGLQPYTNPSDIPVLTVADIHFYGPAETWPKELVNYPWIDFWHHLDAALAAAAIPGMGAELLGDDAWNELFTAGAARREPPDRDVPLDPAAWRRHPADRGSGRHGPTRERGRRHRRDRDPLSVAPGPALLRVESGLEFVQDGLLRGRDLASQAQEPAGRGGDLPRAVHDPRADRRDHAGRQVLAEGGGVLEPGRAERGRGRVRRARTSGADGPGRPPRRRARRRPRARPGAPCRRACRRPTPRGRAAPGPPPRGCPP